jgi:hypothetical protein
MTKGPNTLDTAENESSVPSQYMKTEPTPSVTSKMSPAAQNMKTGPDALGNAENNSGSEKHENGTRRPRYRRKRVRERKT